MDGQKDRQLLLRSIWTVQSQLPTPTDPADYPTSVQHSRTHTSFN